jgi:hypothetical protein
MASESRASTWQWSAPAFYKSHPKFLHFEAKRSMSDYPYLDSLSGIVYASVNSNNKPFIVLGWDDLTETQNDCDSFKKAAGMTPITACRR